MRTAAEYDLAVIAERYRSLLAVYIRVGATAVDGEAQTGLRPGEIPAFVVPGRYPLRKHEAS